MKVTKIGRTPAAAARGRRLILLTAAAICMTCASSYAQTVLGSPGAGFQTWTAADLNNNGAPFWDWPTVSFGSYSGNADSKNVGFCLTSTGDCVGIGSAIFAPGALPYWGMPYDPVNDVNGAIDPKVYFVSNNSRTLKATLWLNLATNTVEINEFGWFATDATGTVLGPRHILFKGGGVPPGTLTPDPVGKTVSFTPTQYFGYYFNDVSEGGCSVYTIANFTDSIDCSGHNMVVFTTNPVSTDASFWIAGEDPPNCYDGDCNLTLVQVTPVRTTLKPGPGIKSAPEFEK
ncbi:MAG TPA: hypothetical protein VGD64_01305 [Acidisarcina sp.]